MNENQNLENWMRFLNPENLRGNLMLSSLYIAFFESFKDYFVSSVRGFYTTGFSGDKEIISKDYNLKVKSKSKNLTEATLLWFKEGNAITDNDLAIFEELRKCRNKCAHDLMNLLFDGLSEDLPEKFNQLFHLWVKIEKWWIINIEIPTETGEDNVSEINGDEIIAHSQVIKKLIFDVLAGDEKQLSYYRDQILKSSN